MNVLKNFEALFIVVLGLACAANFALDTAAVEESAPASAAALASYAPLAATPGMHVVVVSAKRLSAAEKAASLEEERKAQKI